MTVIATAIAPTPFFQMMQPQDVSHVLKVANHAPNHLTVLSAM